MKIKRLFFYFLPIIFVFTGCSNKINFDTLEAKEKQLIREEISDELVSEIYEIVFAIEKKDFNLLNFYVHPTFGFYDVFKIDGIKTVVHKRSFNNYTYEGLEELSHIINEREDDINYRAIKFDTPKFDCSYENDKYYGWTKGGLFLSANIDKYLTNYMEDFNKKLKDFYIKQDFYKAKVIEKTSYKVILTPNIIFYITRLDDRFYITLIDRLTTDCSKDN